MNEENNVNLESTTVNLQPNNQNNEQTIISTSINNDSGISINTNNIDITTSTDIVKPVSIDTNVSNYITISEEQYKEITEEVKTEEVKTEEVKTEVINKEKDKFVVLTSIINRMLKNIEFLISKEDRILLSTFVQFIFNSDGLEIRATDGQENFIAQKDSTYTYTEEENFCLDRGFITEFISKIAVTEIEFKRDIDNPKYIDINTVLGEFKFSEKLDDIDGQSINIENPIDLEDVTFIDVDNFKEWQNLLSNCYPFAENKGDNLGGDIFGGIYCNETIIGSNSRIINIKDNISALTNSVMFMSPGLCKAIYSINFENNAKVGLKYLPDRKYAAYIIIQTSNIMITSILKDDDEYDNYPVENIRAFKKLDFGQTITFNKSPLLNLLDVANIFTQDFTASSSTDQKTKYVSLIFKPGVLEIKSKNNLLNGKIATDGCIQEIAPINLDCNDLAIIINNIKDQNITIRTITSDPSLIGFIQDKDFIIASAISQ